MKSRVYVVKAKTSKGEKSKALNTTKRVRPAAQGCFNLGDRANRSNPGTGCAVCLALRECCDGATRSGLEMIARLSQG
jgi:hypothetical protein